MVLNNTGAIKMNILVRAIISTLIVLAVMTLTVGCASMSDRGDVTQTSVKLPDGSKMTFVRIQRIRLFTPSTEEKVTFIEKPAQAIVRVDNLEQNYQNGMGPSLISGAIQAGATVGGAYLISEGLSDSGDDTSINNGNSNSSSSKSTSSSRQGQGQLQGQSSSNYNKNINKSNGGMRRGW